MDELRAQALPAANLCEFFVMLRTHRLRWLLPALLVSGVVAVYAATMSETWEVSQGVMVRNNAVAKDSEPGEFNGTGPMRRSEDTIVEVCTSARVLREALTAVGPPADWSLPLMAWPNEKVISSLRSAMSIKAPHGAEFATTEVFYVKLKGTDRDRALKLLVAICDSLRTRMGEIRNERAAGLLSEVRKTVELAQSDLDLVTAELKHMEQAIGTDLVELRILHQSPNGQGDLVRALITAEQEVVDIKTKNKVSQDLLTLLESAKQDPRVLVSAPPDLLTSHPTLGQLREALLQAELRIAALRKNLTDQFPTVKAALTEADHIRNRIANELENTQRVVSADMRLLSGRLPILENKRRELHRRLEKLAEVRAEYNNLVNLVRHRQQALERAEQRLADVRARQAVALSASIISFLDAPEMSSEPVGPTRGIVLLVGIVGGLMTGFAMLFLTVAELPLRNDEIRVPATLLRSIGLRPARPRRTSKENSSRSSAEPFADQQPLTASSGST